MKEYPSIPAISEVSVRDGNTMVYAFEKWDGSNVRVEFSKKQGFHKFGSRRRLMDETDPMLGKAKGLILEKYTDPLAEYFKECRVDRGIAYFEFYGSSSFAGTHNPDDQHEVRLIDVELFKTGIIFPKEFLGQFGTDRTPSAKLLWQGPFNTVKEGLVPLVKKSQLDGMPLEGVVCKCSTSDRRYPHRPAMFKVKSEAWLTKLKEYCKGDEELFNKLA